MLSISSIENLQPTAYRDSVGNLLCLTEYCNFLFRLLF